MRIKCKLWGCWCHEEYPACGRCGAQLYDADFVQIAKLQRLMTVWEWVKGVRFYRQCAVCKKRIWFAGLKACCSQKCWDEWLPF
jgi:hypothetical protein